MTRRVNGESKTPLALSSRSTASHSSQRGYSSRRPVRERVDLAPVRPRAEVGEVVLVAGQQRVAAAASGDHDQLDHHRRLPVHHRGEGARGSRRSAARTARCGRCLPPAARRRSRGCGRPPRRGGRPRASRPAPSSRPAAVRLADVEDLVGDVGRSRRRTFPPAPSRSGRPSARGSGGRGSAAATPVKCRELRLELGQRVALELVLRLVDRLGGVGPHVTSSRCSPSSPA